MINYRVLLEQNGIYDVDDIDEFGHFYREFKELDDNTTVGYEGIIKYDENGTHILYTKLEYLDFESYLDETLAYNAEYTNKLIGKNIDGDDFTVNLAINESRNCNELFEEYSLDRNLFNKKQRYLMHIFEIKHKISELENKEQNYLKKIQSIDSIYNALTEGLNETHRIERARNKRSNR